MRFLFFILMAFIPYLSYGASDFDTVESQQLIASVQSDVDSIRDKDIQKIRDFINSEDPEFINEISSLNEHEQIGQMRNYLAKKAFDYYYDKYMTELKQKSAETGREIKTRRFEGDFIEQLWWLDRGDLDKDKCKKDGFNICDYPDGFEEYEIKMQVYGNPKESQNFTVTLIVRKDDIANNANKVFDITLSAHQTTNSSDAEYSFSTSVILDVGGFVKKYDEHHRWLNQEAADTRAGKYRKPTKKEKKEWKKKYKGSPFGKLRMLTDDRREWQSDWLPDAAITSIAADYVYSYTQSENKQ